MSPPQGIPIHLKPTAPLAERVLLPGDPHRALLVAQAILQEPRMFNHTRGLWGYTGRAADGELLTVQSTGMGGPSAAIVAHELIDLGAQVLLRIGTCGALDDGLALGTLVTAERVLATDGASRALGAGDVVEPDPELAAALRDAGAEPVTAVTTDLFYDGGAHLHEWRRAGARVVEMEAATLLAVAGRRAVPAAVLLAVTDQLATRDGQGRQGTGGGGHERISAADYELLGGRLAEAAWAGLSRRTAAG